MVSFFILFSFIFFDFFFFASLNLSRLGSARSSQAVFFKTRLVQAKPHLLKARLGLAWYDFSSQAQARLWLGSSRLVRSFINKSLLRKIL
jgi:hypothetical protein